jgi:hypothetical protein
MPEVVYRGSVEEIQGSRWTVPDSVLQAGQGRQWIESQHRQQLAEEAAKQEAEARQRELLAARVEAARLQAEADAATPSPSRDQLKQELVNELDALTRSVLTGAAAVESKELRIVERCDEWEQRHETLLSDAEARISEAEAQVQAAQAITQASSEQVQSELDNHRLELRSLESELRETVSTLQGPQGEVGPIGLAGAGTTVAMELPTETDPSSWAMRWFGREGLVAGDGALVPTPTALRVFRYTGTSWVEGPAIEPKQELINAKASILQQNKPAIVGAGGGSGPSGPRHEELAVRTITLGASGGATPIWSSINWAKDRIAQPITSVSLGIEISGSVPVLGAGTYYTRIDLTLRGTDTQYTIAPELTAGGSTGAGSALAEYIRDHLTVTAFQTPAAPPTTSVPVLTVALGLDADPSGIAGTPLMIRGWALPAGEKGSLVWSAP